MSQTDESTESRIALFVGGDLDDESTAELQRQLASCPEARSCHGEMYESLAALHECRDRDGGGRSGDSSLWPQLESRLRTPRRRGSLESLQPWVPAMTVAALVLALLTVATSPSPRTSGSSFAVEMPNTYAPSFQPVRSELRVPREEDAAPRVPLYAVPGQPSVDYDSIDEFDDGRELD